MKKNIIALLVVMSLVLSLTACGGTEDSTKQRVTTKTENTTSNETEKKDADKEETKVEAKEEDVTLTIIHHMGEDGKNVALDAWIEAVEETHPNYHYEAIKVSNPTEMEKMLHTKIAAGEPADIFFGCARHGRNLMGESP